MDFWIVEFAGAMDDSHAVMDPLFVSPVAVRRPGPTMIGGSTVTSTATSSALPRGRNASS